MECLPIRTVAKISETIAEEIGVDFTDRDGNYVIGLALAQQLDVVDFDLIMANYDGILPQSNTKPILRPRP